MIFKNNDIRGKSNLARLRKNFKEIKFECYDIRRELGNNVVLLKLDYYVNSLSFEEIFNPHQKCKVIYYLCPNERKQREDLFS